MRIAIAAATMLIGSSCAFAEGQCGTASYYAYTGRPTANGEAFDGSGMTAAHKTLPMNTWVKVIDQRNGHSIVVRINDRGPYIKGRIIDLSYHAMHVLAGNDGLVPVCVVTIPKASVSHPTPAQINRLWSKVF